jgi:hypothetical protein
MNPKLLFISAVPNSRRLATAAGSLTWGGGGDNGGHVLRQTTSRGLCGCVD